MKKILFSLLISLALVFNACDDFLDINDNPNDPSDATIVQLLPAGQAGIVFGFSNALNRIASDNVQYFSGRYDSWNITPSDVSNGWRFSLYAGGLADLEQVIIKATETENYHFVGVAKLYKAYAYSIMVDLWNDIPFSQANNPEFEFPEFDEASSIYDNLFLLIDEAIADLEKPLPDLAADLSSVDLVYNGDINSWKKMGYTLKLKMYNQIRLKAPGLAKTQIENLVASGNLMSKNSDDFLFQFGTSTSPENRHPGFITDYETKGEAYVNKFFYDTMFDKSDPRIPYYFYNQNTDFEGRYTGDPTPTGNDGDTRSIQGLYPVGGKYDNGEAETAGGSDATGNGRYRMITNVMRLFIECEAALALDANVSDTPKNLLEDALKATFTEINSLSAPDITDDVRNAYITSVLDMFDNAATNEEKLAVVMQEKWIAMFGNAIEAWNDYRRTGYPVLPDPLTASNNVVANRYPYPNDELNSNPNAPEALENNMKVFWDN
nr:SusD/RagB family nutrient-binding outer membrane lipoprotein [uncultured Draconibacterium sp.]